MNTLQKELKIRGYSEQTKKAYEHHNRAFLKLLDKSPREVTKNDIKYYVEHLIDSGYERATINLAISSLNFYYREILNRKFKIKRLRSQKKLHDVLSIEEVHRLFDAAKNPKHKTMLMFLYYSGVRLSELINIRSKDIDFERNQIHVREGKGRNDRFITIEEELAGQLKKFIEGKDYLFTTVNGKMSKRTVQKICKIYAKKANIKKNVTPHTIRRTFATHSVEKKVELHRVQRLMGHKNISTTENYLNYAYISILCRC